MTTVSSYAYKSSNQISVAMEMSDQKYLYWILNTKSPCGRNLTSYAWCSIIPKCTVYQKKKTKRLIKNEIHKLGLYFLIIVISGGESYSLSKVRIYEPIGTACSTFAFDSRGFSGTIGCSLQKSTVLLKQEYVGLLVLSKTVPCEQ